jgi:hypothetical protein
MQFRQQLLTDTRVTSHEGDTFRCPFCRHFRPANHRHYVLDEWLGQVRAHGDRS